MSDTNQEVFSAASLPDDWNIKSIFELGGNVKDCVQTGPFGAQLHSSDYKKEGVPLLLIRNITDDGLNLKGLPRISSEDASRLNKYSLQRNDLVFSRVGRVGSCFLVTENEHGWIISGQLLRIRLQTSDVDFRYVLHALRSAKVQSYITGSSVGSTRESINTSILANLQLPIPPLHEQRKIAEILSTVDEKMVVIDEQLAKTQELKKGLMQRLLTKGIGHTAFKDSTLGEIPESWEAMTIDKHVSIFFGFPFKSEKFNQEGKGTRLLRGINVTVGSIRFNDSIDRYWEEPFDEYDKYSLQEGDLVISMDGSLVGRNFARVPESALPLLLVQRVACIRAKHTINLEYLSQIVGGPLFINYVDAVKTSSGIPHISGKQIKDFKIPVPPLSEQNQIAEILTTIDDKLQVLTDKKVQYQELKRGLMQQLLTGQRRVRVAAELATLA